MYVFRTIARSDAEEISRWRYPEPYATYDGDPSSVPGLLDPRYNYHAVTDPEGVLVGYFCFGADATVPAGRRLGLYDDDALDVGLGMRPDLTGRGLGPDFVRAGLRFARQAFSPRLFVSPSPPSTEGPSRSTRPPASRRFAISETAARSGC